MVSPGVLFLGQFLQKYRIHDRHPRSNACLAGIRCDANKEKWYNDLEKKRLSSEDILKKYKGQQALERGFSFLKDPGFFAHSVFLKSPHRIEVLAMLMGLCLLVYTIGQRQLRLSLKQ